MITAVDTNILLDLVTPDAPHADESDRALAEAWNQGSIVISEVTYAELAVRFDAKEWLDAFLGDTRTELSLSDDATLFSAGKAWMTYLRRRPDGLVCPQCGTANPTACINCGINLRPRQHVLADFMIGAHALHHADQLLTRDRGFYGSYFPELRLA